jgi:hypothetical protein
MTENHGEENGRPQRAQARHSAERQLKQVTNDALERDFDAALAKYANVEPRFGLEERLLANLRAERERAAVRVWWRWPAAAAATVVVLILALFLSWRTGHPQSGKTSAHNPSEGAKERPIAKVAQKPHFASEGASARSANRPRHPAAVATSEPRLEQFPSPRPLSEQEEILARYVATYPEHATLVAAARTEALRLDAIEEMRDPASQGNSQP